MQSHPGNRRRQPAPLAALAVLSVALLAGCASAGTAGGGAGGGWDAARQWGCDPGEVQREHEAAGDVALEPQVGWSACQLLALNGAPTETRLVEGPAGDTWHLFFGSGDDARMVTLREDVTGDWRVAAVVGGGGAG